MSDLVTQSPFDAGRTPCPQGGEDRWSARWLMEQMGYDTPKAEFYDEFMDADGAYSFKATADALCWGRTTMLRNLRQAGVLTSKNLPYRRYAHHFKVVPQTYTTRNGETVATATTYVLPSGVAFIAKKLDGISI